jgi:hypothetical protein
MQQQLSERLVYISQLERQLASAQADAQQLHMERKSLKQQQEDREQQLAQSKATEKQLWSAIEKLQGEKNGWVHSTSPGNLNPININSLAALFTCPAARPPSPFPRVASSLPCSTRSCFNLLHASCARAGQQLQRSTALASRC